MQVLRNKSHIICGIKNRIGIPIVKCPGAMESLSNEKVKLKR